MLVATPSDLAGDRSVVARAEAVAPAVAAASDEIERDRRLPPALLDKLARGTAVPSAVAALLKRDRDRSRHLLPCDRDHRTGRCIDRLVPEPGRRLRDVGGLSRSAGRTRDLRRRPSRGAGLGSRSPGEGGRMRRRLSRHGRLGVRLRRPPRHVARRALPDLQGRWLAAARGRRRAGRTHHAGAFRGRRVDRHLEHGRPARHRERPVRAQGFLRACRSLDHPRVRARMPRERTALSDGQRHLLPGRLCRCGLRHRARRARLLPRSRQEQGAARQQERDQGQCRGAGRLRAGRGQSPRRRVPICCNRWRRSGSISAPAR